MSEFGIIARPEVETIKVRQLYEEPLFDSANKVRSIADPEAISRQLVELRNALSKVVEDRSTTIQLDTMVLKLALTAEGQVAFIGSAGVEASIELTFKRPEA